MVFSRLGLRSLRGQVVSLFLGLLLLLQSVGFLTTRAGIERNAAEALSQETDTAQRVLIELLAQREVRLTEGARVLASDYGFRSAIASSDGATLTDALNNHSARIGADVAIYTDAQFQTKGATRDSVEAFVAQGRAQANKRSAGSSRSGTHDLSLVLLEGQAYQVVAVPVKAPLVIGWVLMGFALDETLLHDLDAIAGVRSVLLHRAGEGAWSIGLGALAASEREDLARQMDRLTRDGGPAIELGSDQHRARFVVLSPPHSGHTFGVLLLRSLDAALAPYRRLQWTLLLLNGVGLLAAVALSVGVGGRIARPLETLQHAARQLGRGDYETPVTLATPGGSTELRHLASALEVMRVQIQDRERQVQRLAYWDPLTGLPNLEQLRSALKSLLAPPEQPLEGRPGAAAPVALVMLDLDRFKHVNDVLGHAYGDRLMKQVSLRLTGLQANSAPRSVLGRSSSDEFVFLLPHSGLVEATFLAQAVRQCFEQPIHLEGQTVDLGAGVGIALYPDHGQDTDALLGRAEVAMYAAKRQTGGVAVYDSQLDTTSSASLSLLSELRQAVTQNQLRLFLQPKIDAATGRVLGAEALVRWKHPTRGMMPPGLFIPFAEQTGFIRELTAWMIATSMETLRGWRLAGHRLKLSINLSTRDLMDADLPGKVAALLASVEADPGWLCLEITESAIMEDPQRALNTLDALHALGLHLSIDDFGTGYSSLAYLKRLPVDELKIDRSFVMHVETDADDVKIVRSTIDLAHNLGMTVVAEGVETAGAWTKLAGLSCDELQGYFIAKPMPADEFSAWMGRWQVPAELAGVVARSGAVAGVGFAAGGADAGVEGGAATVASDPATSAVRA